MQRHDCRNTDYCVCLVRSHAPGEQLKVVLTPVASLANAVVHSGRHSDGPADSANDSVAAAAPAFCVDGVMLLIILLV
ncbi:hypothetical protein FVE85_8581 [Porphyridium purpureum]|uniref:Uncharacterized protein n=1 Tax=Porphyridium purpureum TaxID=35688 RepID=A0A5J4YP87_PORPP|nr:hypothetical protein FVE85_8581 [Porphyridium purpureum]|eukprot:POR6635..scf296_7